MKLICPLLGLALSMLTSAAHSSDTKQMLCELYVEFGHEMIAHRMPCVDGSRFSVQFSGLTVSYQVKKHGALIKVSPQNFAFFNGKKERSTDTHLGAAAVAFYDRDASDFVENRLNRPAGTIKLSRREE